MSGTAVSRAPQPERGAPVPEHSLHAVPAAGPFRGLARTAVRARLRGLRHGQLTLVEGRHAETFGMAQPGVAPIPVQVLDPGLYRALLMRGTLGAAEAFMDGAWTCADVPALIRLLFQDRAVLEGLDRSWSRWLKPLLRFGYWLQRNHRAGARRNIAAHYDLGNEFFALFLDPTLMYSCAFFEHADTPLEQASVAKLERVCRKLRLGPGDHVLEIGTGWGGLALHAATRHGCRVTTTTISQRQFEHARARVAAAGLQDRITVVQQDYRDLRGSYDKLVSIEMLEAVGAQYLRDYFQQCARLLKPDGLLLVQSIVIADHAFAHASTDVDFLKKYIFPGSCLPSVGAIAAASGTTDLRTLHVEDIGPHYCLTLRRWREAFRRNLDRVRALGFDARFVRMWDYYFSYCEGVFSTHHTSDVQWLWGKPGLTAPLPAVVPEGTVAWRAH